MWVVSLETSPTMVALVPCFPGNNGGEAAASLGETKRSFTEQYYYGITLLTPRTLRGGYDHPPPIHHPTRTPTHPSLHLHPNPRRNPPPPPNYMHSRPSVYTYIPELVTPFPPIPHVLTYTPPPPTPSHPSHHDHPSVIPN